jgi:hypothetical protein
MFGLAHDSDGAPSMLLSLMLGSSAASLFRITRQAVAHPFPGRSLPQCDISSGTVV